MTANQRENIKPDSDPTTATNRLVETAIKQTHDLFEAQLKSLGDTVNARLDGMKTAIELVEKIPTALDKGLSNLSTNIDQRFKTMEETFKTVDVRFDGVQKQFSERDTRVEQTLKDSKTAVDAAFSAADKSSEKQRDTFAAAAAKSEAAFTKSIDGIERLMAAEIRGLSTEIQNLKVSLTEMKSTTSGASARTASLIGGGVALIMGAGLVISLIVNFAK